MVYASQVPYWNAVFLVKFAFLRLYYRLVIPSMKRLRCCLNAISLITFVTFFLVQGANLFWCIPISQNFDPVGQCWAFFELKPYFISTFGHVFTDLMSTFPSPPPTLYVYLFVDSKSDL